MNISKTAIAAALALTTVTASAAVRDTLNLNHGWEFRFDGQQTWTSVDLPHDFQTAMSWVEPPHSTPDHKVKNEETYRLKGRGYKEMAIGWYQKTLDVPEEWKGRRIVIDFQGIMLVGDVYLNGERIGGTDYGYLGFEVDVTDRLRYGEQNLLSVMADTREPENSRWYTGGGLYRDVSIVLMPKDRYFVRHPLQIHTDTTGQVGVSAELFWDNRRKDEYVNLNLKITNAEGKIVVDRTSRIKRRRVSTSWAYVLDSVKVPDAKLWSCESPYLYKAIVTLVDNKGQAIDCVSEPFGIRTIEYGPAFGLKLNGQKVLLKGAACHHTLGALGAAAYPRAIEKWLQLLKSYGFNHIRTSHNPFSEDFMRLCDRYGFLVTDELYDKWLTEYSGGRTEWSNIWQHDVEEWVRRDRNHPSVILWSLGNEVQVRSNLPYNDWGITPYKLLDIVTKRYDDTRPTTVAMHPNGRSMEGDSLPAALALETEIASYNYRYNYFEPDGRRFPHLIFYQSEANTIGMPANYYGMNRDRVIGLAYWGISDYIGESAGWPKKGWDQGLFDITLQPKPNAYHLKSYFTDEPTVHIGIVENLNAGFAILNGTPVGYPLLSENWNRTPGDSVVAFVYTNADEVELLVNGRSQGRRQNPQDNNHRNKIRWEKIPYEDGVIEAIGYRQGKAIARHRIETTGQAVALRLEPDPQQWHADGEDLQYVRITAIDKKGRQVPTDSHDVSLTITGDARLIAVSNGDIESNALATDHHISLFNGSALAILRAGTIPASVTLNATTDGLKSATVKLKQN